MKNWKRYALAMLVCMLSIGRALPAAADESSNPFSDVSPSDPAFQAIVRLHDAGYLQGYPDGYFHGSRPITRYEMTILVDRVVSEMEFQMNNPAGAMKVTQRAVADAKLALDQYGADIKDLKTKTAALDKTVTALQTNADRAQVHLYAYLRAPGTFTESVNAIDPTGKPLPNSTAVTDGVSNYVQGNNSRGTGVEVLRMIIRGNIDKQTSYAMRLENKNYLGQVNVIGLDTVNPSPSAYANQSLVRLNYMYLKYQLRNSPVYFVGGKYPAGGDLGLTFSNDYYNGGYAGVTGKLNGFVGFGQQGGPDLGSTSPFAYVPSGTANSVSQPHTQFAIMSHWGYSLTPKLTVGANMLDLSALPQKIWSTTANNFLAFNQPLASGSLAATYKPSPTLTLSVEGLERFGKDPTTNAKWADRRAVWFQGLIGNATPADGNTYGEVGFAGTGYNSVINLNTGLNGTPFYTYYYSGQANDRRMTYGSLYRYVGSNSRVGLTYLNWGLNVPEPLVPGTGIPAGSTLQKNDNRALFLSTQVEF